VFVDFAIDTGTLEIYTRAPAIDANDFANDARTPAIDTGTLVIDAVTLTINTGALETNTGTPEIDTDDSQTMLVQSKLIQAHPLRRLFFKPIAITTKHWV
jgi:hypothetical protein